MGAPDIRLPGVGMTRMSSASHSDPVHDAFNYPTMMNQKRVLFGHTLIRIVVLACHIRMSSTRCRLQYGLSVVWDSKRE